MKLLDHRCQHLDIVHKHLVLTSSLKLCQVSEKVFVMRGNKGNNKGKKRGRNKNKGSLQQSPDEVTTVESLPGKSEANLTQMEDIQASCDTSKNGKEHNTCEVTEISVNTVLSDNTSLSSEDEFDQIIKRMDLLCKDIDVVKKGQDKIAF